MPSFVRSFVRSLARSPVRWLVLSFGCKEKAGGSPEEEIKGWFEKEKKKYSSLLPMQIISCLALVETFDGNYPPALPQPVSLRVDSGKE